MASFLTLVQETAEESGTFSSIGSPETLSGVTGRSLRVKNWVARAYRDIQRSQRGWKWLEAEFSGSTIANTQRYDSAALSISERFSNWIPIDHDGMQTFTVYLTSEGQATEGFMRFYEWHAFRRTYLTAANSDDTGKPNVFSIDPDQKIALYPIPDADYTIRGLYRKTPQVLSNDADVPEMPEEFHEIIKWKALEYLGIFDEAFDQLPAWRSMYKDMLVHLQRHQLPTVGKPGPLA